MVPPADPKEVANVEQELAVLAAGMMDVASCLAAILNAAIRMPLQVLLPNGRIGGES